ncbi:MAG: dTMP kinase [Verrucomicrobia bacterium]|nr:dTMP kinase [Verrucomicrobiota bacterium]
MAGILITFEGTEGSGKSTQIARLTRHLQSLGHTVRTLREPGGTPIGEEIRHTLKHSEANYAMTPEAELLLMNASRAQLVREIIRPALQRGEIILCDRFYDSTTAYQGYGRQLDLNHVREIIAFAVGETRPDLTLMLNVPVHVSEKRRHLRQARLLEVPRRNGKTGPLPFDEKLRDRMEEADRSFFERVEQGYTAIAASEPNRIQVIDATKSKQAVWERIWEAVAPLLEKKTGVSAG